MAYKYAAWLELLLLSMAGAGAQMVVPTFNITPILVNKTQAREYANFLKPFVDRVGIMRCNIQAYLISVCCVPSHTRVYRRARLLPIEGHVDSASCLDPFDAWTLASRNEQQGCC